MTRVLYLNELLAAKKVHPPPWATGDAALAADYQAWVCRQAKHATCFAIQNVAEYFFEREHAWAGVARDVFPSAAPPYPVFWMEYLLVPPLGRRHEHNPESEVARG